MSEETYLSRKVTVKEYKSMEENRDINKIVTFVRERFTERYISPVDIDKMKKNGFTIMAISCLMIEALESFYNGWPDTRYKSKKAFNKFFTRNHNFSVLDKYHQDFYIHIRCSILHQAETTGGWHIRRYGSLYDKNTKTINATKFLNEIKKSLENYCLELSDSDWEDNIWKNFRKKMKSVCNYCNNEYDQIR